jgi:valyl-tRNA synthetase
MLDKTFRPNEVETRLYSMWEQAGAFKCGVKPDADPYCIVIPPPNVTGTLHMGHALNNTLQDILVRFERMRGRDVLWQPGTDHAGIATQMVVERQLESENATDRRTMGRDAFVERVWEWKEESGGAIIEQLRRLGASCDWSRERFTMDEGLSAAVLRVFVTLYKEGLIYKDQRLVNWDPKLLTAVSDIEVQSRDAKGHLWHFKYPLEGHAEKSVTVATTRPETMLGDTAVAVHPDDGRYKDLVGKYVILPLVGRRLQIVADEYVDPEQGTGAVKITPAHDFNDFEVGRRHDLEVINIFDQHACINENAPAAYQGLDRYEARKKVLAELEAQGLLAQTEEHEHAVPYGDRSGVVIEPWLTEQWYVDAKTLAAPAIKSVEEGRTVFVPKNWERTYFEWMRNIQPWCISRQLWWGHQIPAWYGPDGEIFVEESEAQALAAAEQHYGEKADLERDPDVLDTWFSSGLWPFSTLGWPEETPELKRYYQTDVLVTGFDIIFFWVARMMMMGLHFMKEEPFHTVYMHALVRDEKGAKMSKSKGNVIDPLNIVDEYGADALRFTLTAMAAQGRDIKMSKSRVEGYRNFGTKIWNAARFCQMNECARSDDFDPSGVNETVNKWIVAEVAKAHALATNALEDYKFNDAAGALYHFVWHIYCDWYLEFIKPLLNGPDGPAKNETRATTAWALDQALILLHPVMPFITEELWMKLGESGTPRKEMLINASWPQYAVDAASPASEEMEWIIRIVSEIRSVRAEMNVPAAAKIPLVLTNSDPAMAQRVERHEDLIVRLARLGAVRTEAKLPEGSIQLIVDQLTMALPLAEIIDLDKERVRLSRELEKVATEIAKLETKLNDGKFMSKAPETVIETQRERLLEANQTSDRLSEALSRLKGVG